MGKFPSIDRGRCTGCDSCLTICPAVFHCNAETGWIEVRDMPEHPEEAVEEAMIMCLADCITWEKPS
jgi:ferredoxin